MAKIESLLKELPTRTAHLYRSIWHKYTQWLQEQNQDEVANDLEYVLSYKLITTYIVSHDDISKDPSLVCEALIWFARALEVDEQTVTQLREWLHCLMKVLSYDSSNMVHVLQKISINLWNPNTDSLQSKHFKTCQDKLKLLLDFQWKFSTNLSFEDRTSVSLKEIKCIHDPENRKCGLAHTSQPNFVLIPNFDSPFTCPVFTMAVYYYLRFQGVKKYYKGDGYDVLSEFEHIPIIRGKSLDQYPRELTVGNWYPTIFKYCELPYTKKNWFQRNPEWPEFPDMSKIRSTPLERSSRGQGQNESGVSFTDSDSGSDTEYTFGIPNFMIEKMNRSKFQPCPNVRIQLFPTDLPANLQPVFDLLNSVLVTNLPLLYKVFPSHDIFMDPTLKTPQNIAFLTGNRTLDIESQQSILSMVIDKKGIASELAPTLIKSDPNENGLLTYRSPEVPENITNSLDEIKSELQNMIQLQSSVGFSQLITVLLEIFQKLDIKRSSKQFVIELLQSCKNDMKRALSNPDPNYILLKSDDNGNNLGALNDSSPELENENNIFESMDEQGPLRKKSRPNYAEDPPSDDENMEELAQVVNQLITRKLNENLAQQTDRIISSIQPMLRDMVREEISLALNTSNTEHYSESNNDTKEKTSNKSKNSISPSFSTENDFEMKPECNDIQSIILEWFTPNPECVHSMNKKYGNKWRLSDPNKSLYKMRKPIVQYYIHLINEEKLNKFDAFKRLELLLDRYGTIQTLSEILESEKKNSYASVT